MLGVVGLREHVAFLPNTSWASLEGYRGHHSELRLCAACETMVPHLSQAGLVTHSWARRREVKRDHVGLHISTFALELLSVLPRAIWTPVPGTPPMGHL